MERLLKRDSAIVFVGLLVLWALTWLYLARGAGLDAAVPMAAMSEADMAAMSTARDPASWALMVGMWWAMMIAMMVPSAAPTILLYAGVHRHAAQGRGTATLAPTGVFLAGYFLAWLLFSIAATALQQALQHAGIVSATTMDSQLRWLSGTVLVAIGLYQLSPFKNACLSHCRAPAEFLSRHWRPGPQGALRLGLLHGAYCVGCCWLLMILLFIGGVMNLAWIAALSLLVLAEKLLPGGQWVGRIAGVALIGWGGAMLLG